MTHFQPHEPNFWNPFIPTERDLTRTNILANKKVAVVVIFGLLLSPLASALYLNRFLNTFKILGYVCFLSMALGYGHDVDERYLKKIAHGIGVLGSIATVAEQSLAIKNARLRN